MSDPRDTPAMRQYRRFKSRHPGCVLLFRMGDFYESFDEDAVTLHKALGLTLTQRTAGIPMAGVPYHQLETYLRRLNAQGYRVAVADQIQDPKDAKGIVERAVTRVVTPGTLTDETLLSESGSSRLAAACIAGREPMVRAAAAVVDLSTGEFWLVDAPAEGLTDELTRRSVREVLVPELFTADAPRSLSEASQRAGASVTTRPAWQFRQSEALEAILGQFGVSTVAGFGLDGDDPCLGPAGAIIRYLIETQAADDDAPKGPGILPRRRVTLAHLRPPRREDPGEHCVVDGTSLRALEVERTIRPVTGEGGVDHSLLGLFLARECAPRTPMGKRLIGEWVRRPLAKREAVEERLAAVAALVEDRAMAAEVCSSLDGVQDIPRISARVALARASPRDLVALARSIAAIPGIMGAAGATPALARVVSALGEASGALGGFADRVLATCVDSPPAHAREGGIIRDGVDAELDEARLLCRDAGAWLAQYQQTLLERHRLPGIKVGYNKVFGYYIELTSAQAASAPAEFSRKQTLKNAERYVTPELRDFEDRVTTAEARAIERERTLFDMLCDEAANLLVPMNAAADAIAELDATWGLAERAFRSHWVRPEMVDEPVLVLREARHPVLGEMLRERFVPNDLDLGVGLSGDGGGATLALITGPNMAGKSTFIRQVALVVLLAHAGSFVPATSARVGMTDRIFTRVGADDALHAGQSTFMVEMTETATILNNCTSRSVVVLDEIGRGTSTLDGLSLAWAIAERLATGEGEGRGPRTLFATHYHEITELQDRLPEHVVNLRVEVREWPAGDPAAQIVFLHRISPGRSDQSYGLHVARLAGVPEGVVSRAREMLHSLEVQHRGVGEDGAAPKPARKRSPQMGLFADGEPHPVIEELRKTHIENLTPLEAFDALRRLRGMVE